MLRKLIGGLGSPCAWSLIGAASYGLVERLADVEGLARQLEVVLHQHAVVEGGDVGGRFSVPSALKVGAVQTTS